MAAIRLFDPITVRNVVFKNRAWVAPMCQYQATGQDGLVREWHRVHYGALSRGGAGLVMVEATGVAPEGRITPLCLGIWNDQQAAEFRPIIDFAHQQGARIGIQLAHAGRKASTYPWMPDSPSGTIDATNGGWPTLAPSAIAFDGLTAPAAITLEQIDQVIDAFVAAAARAVAVGFDVLEVHSAHGYLLHEFLSPLSNQRDDEYGGTLENRSRLLRRIVAAIRHTQPEVPLFVRFSASEWVEGGFDVDETAVVAEWVSKDGADLIDISSGGNVATAPIQVRPSYQVPFAEEVKRATGLTVSVAGLINTASQAETIVTTGQADAVCVARAALRDPHFALNWAKELNVSDVSIPDSLWRGYA